MSRHAGPDLFDLFDELGDTPAIELGAMKKQTVYDLTALMKAQGVSRAELARRMGVGLAIVRGLLEPTDTTTALATIASAAAALRAHATLRLTARPARAEKPAEVPAPTAASPKPRTGKSPPRGERAATATKRRAAKRQA